jgi:hypothetical protein
MMNHILYVHVVCNSEVLLLRVIQCYMFTDIADDSDTSVWCGGGDPNREGHWEWYDSYTNTYKKLIYKNWGHSEPNSSKLLFYLGVLYY